MRSEEDVPILALDGIGHRQAFDLAKIFGPRVYAIKIHDLYDRHGPDIVHHLAIAGAKRVFVDFKLFDIPNTIGNRAAAISNSGAKILTVDAGRGYEGLKIARLFFRGEIFGITELTSEKSANDPEKQLAYVLDLARQASQAQIAGVQCAPKYLAQVSNQFPELKTLVPGIRLKTEEPDDHAMTMTPREALLAGSTHQVWGRAIVQAKDPTEAFEAHVASLKSAFAELKEKQ